MNALLLLLTVASTLVLRSGDRIAVEGPVREEKGVVMFRSGGVLYSMPASEIEKVEAAPPAPERPKAVEEEPKTLPKRLRVSDEERKRILEQLEKNRAGTPAPKTTPIEEQYPPPTQGEVEQQKREEWEWRREARAYEESLRRAQEDLQLLETRVRELQDQIESLFNLGYKPHQFTYQTTQLARTQEKIPAARLEVERAQRAYDQFREDARRLGILPGWLR